MCQIGPSIGIRVARSSNLQDFGASTCMVCAEELNLTAVM